MGFNTTLMVVMFFVVFAFVGMSTFMFDVVTTYDVPVDDSYQDIFNEYGYLQDQYADQQNTVDGGEINPEGFDQGVFTNTVVAAKQAQQSGNLFMRFLWKIPEYFSIPVVLVSIVVSAVLFLTLMAFMRYIGKEGI